MSGRLSTDTKPPSSIAHSFGNIGAQGMHSVQCLSIYFVFCSAITAQAIAQTKPLSSLAIAVATFSWFLSVALQNPVAIAQPLLRLPCNRLRWFRRLLRFLLHVVALPCRKPVRPCRFDQ